MTQAENIEELRRYISAYGGNITEALQSIGGVRRVRAILGLEDYAALDPRLYVLPE